MKETTKKTSNQIISDFLTSKKKVLFTILAVIICAVAAFGILSGVQKNNLDSMINSTTELDNMYEELINENGDKDAFISFGLKLVEDYKGTKAELISYSRMASYYYDEDDFSNALEYYTLAYTKFPNDIAASVYMFNAAMSQEELGATDEAINLLEEIVTLYKSSDIDVADISADVPEALFNLGRLYEEQGNLTKAVEQYEVLVAEYQAYNLSNLAKSRLLSLK